MRLLFLYILLLLSSVSLCARNVQFGGDGLFKIVQFTDTHFIYGDSRSDIVLERMSEVLENEKPDIVILTGDVIFGPPADSSLMTVLDLISEHGIPFGITFGNHDYEQGFDYRQLLGIMERYPENLTVTEPGISGYSNFVIPVKSSDGTKDAAVLYCLDSNTYSKIEGIGGYDYIHSDQIQWYMETSLAFTAGNGGVPVQSYAFFHIPLPEYAYAAADMDSVLFGTRMEPVCSPVLNSGLFSAMKQMGDIRGVFVGHDHDNDFAVSMHGILLAYGRYSGGDTVYNHLSNGVRVIELRQDGKSFDTWICLSGGRIIQKVTYPDSFLK